MAAQPALCVTVEHGMLGAMTQKSTPPALVRDLRDQIINVISNYKAYDVPAVATRVGLAEGDGQEAFSSKARYVKVRLEALPAAEVLKIGRALVQEDEDFALLEAVRKIEEVAGPQITGLTRRRLLTVFENRSLASEISDLELVRGLWPIQSMTTAKLGGRMPLEEYLIQHTVRNDDLSGREVLEEVDFLTCSRTQVFKLLEAVVHPEAVSPELQAETVKAINVHLAGDGFALTRSGSISRSPIYAVKQIAIGMPADTGISEALAAFDPEGVHARWSAALERRSTDPEGAITLARTLLEDVCKWLLNETGGTWEEADDLPTLYKRLAKALNLAPDGHTEQTFKQILGSCQSIVEGLGALRNKLGDAHSVGPRRVRPSVRHAELAVNLAGTMATFLVETWNAPPSRRPERSDRDRHPKGRDVRLGATPRARPASAGSPNLPTLRPLGSAPVRNASIC